MDNIKSLISQLEALEKQAFGMLFPVPIEEKPTLKQRVGFFFLKLKPSKLTVFAWFFRIVIVMSISSYYVFAINDQMKKDEKIDVFSGFGNVINNQFNFITNSFSGLLKNAEGYQEQFYPDNKGYAVGYGYNPTQNSIEYNRSILDYAGVDSSTKEKILQNAGKYKNTSSAHVPPEFKNIHFTKDQLDKMASYAQNSYERSFFRVLNHKLDNKGITGTRRNHILQTYTTLPENKKAVLTHMAYKVGEQNLEKYNTFFGNLIAYLEEPSKENKMAVANGFTYKYTQNGKTLRDTRVEHMHRDLFAKEISTESKQTPSNSPAPIKTKLSKKELSDQEKFEKAMKEVKGQMGLNSVWKIMTKTADKLNKTFPEKKLQALPMYMEAEDQGYYENDE